MSATSKWSDAAVKDLTFAILMSNNTDGSVAVNANWDNVAETMTSWGYNFTKSAMSQHWSKKVLKEFKDRHSGTGTSNGSSNANVVTTPKKTATPRKPRTPKAPGTGGGKKRPAQDDEDFSQEGSVTSPGTRTKTPRSASKKIKYEEPGDKHSEVSGDDSSAHGTQTKTEGADGDFGVA